MYSEKYIKSKPNLLRDNIFYEKSTIIANEKQQQNSLASSNSSNKI